MTPSEPVNLTNCDREPIHIPGSIQPHGCLLACDMAVSIVQRHSANAAEFLSLEGPINGQPLAALVGDQITHDIRNALASAPDPARPGLLLRQQMANGRIYDISVHRHAGHAIIEFEATDTNVLPVQLARELIGRIRMITTSEELLRKTPALLRAVLDYDRVMIYRFEEDGAGKVESEAKRPDLESFQGQYFPASDIPQQARALYLKNSIRIISDARGQRVSIEPVFDGSGEPLDLSYAHLRSVSPIHLEYLRNMGVAASMSISIIVDGALWGLIACHNYSPKIMTLPQRIASEMFCEFFSMHLIGLLNHHKLNLVTAARDSLDRFLQRASQQTDVMDLLTEVLPDFQTMLDCDGIGFFLQGEWRSIGTVPPAEVIPLLAQHISETAEDRIWTSNQLTSVFPPAASFYQDVSGVLAIPLSQVSDDCLLFFRKERLQTLNWAGNPDKSYETGPFGDRLTPRKSFAIWKETVERHSVPWSEADIEVASAIHSAAVEVVLRHSELMQEERDKADLRQRLLNEELNHRVKNILAVIKSLIATPAREAATLQDYIGSLKGRIQALAHAHDQVIRGSGGGDIRGLLEAELLPYTAGTAVIQLEGPTAKLDGRAYAVAALVFHEMCTNAAKYGALSRPGGHLTIRWGLDGAGDLEINWQEAGGPQVTPPSRKGFGSSLIERSIPFDLGGSSEINFDITGIRARMTIPAKFIKISEGLDALDPKVVAEIAPALSAKPENAAVLLVEDQVLIAMDVEMMLSDHGFANVVTANSVSMALEQIETLVPDVAVLDINLGHETSIPVALELYKRNVPFVFATGYDDKTQLPEELVDVPVVRKPYNSETLLDALSRLLVRI